MCNAVDTEREKREIAVEIKLVVHGLIKTPRWKANEKYLRMLKTDSIKPNEMIEKVNRDCVRKTRKILETRLSRRNLIKYLDRFYCEIFKAD